MTIKQLHLLIAGRVQGVSYRYHCAQQARQLGLTGWVRNLPDGRVELLAEGDEAALDTLLEWTYQGPILAKVTAIEVKHRQADGRFAGFDIR